jgi:hypothetical protein
MKTNQHTPIDALKECVTHLRCNTLVVNVDGLAKFPAVQGAFHATPKTPSDGGRQIPTKRKLRSNAGLRGESPGNRITWPQGRESSARAIQKPTKPCISAARTGWPKETSRVKNWNGFGSAITDHADTVERRVSSHALIPVTRVASITSLRDLRADCTKPLIWSLAARIVTPSKATRKP